MFTASPTKSMSFASIGIIGKRTRNSLVQIWTRAGKYAGFEDSSSGWELCYNKIVLLKQGLPTYIDLACSSFTPSGTTRSFHVYAKAGMTIENEATTSSNALLNVSNGAILTDLFEQVKRDGLVAGSLR